MEIEDFISWIYIVLRCFCSKNSLDFWNEKEYNYKADKRNISVEKRGENNGRRQYRHDSPK